MLVLIGEISDDIEMGESDAKSRLHYIDALFPSGLQPLLAGHLGFVFGLQGSPFGAQRSDLREYDSPQHVIG